MTTLATEGLSRSFGGLLAVNNVRLSVAAGEIRALIGPNGAGKSTLLNLLAGTLKPSAGKVLLGDQDITHLAVHQRALKGLSRSYQVVNLFPELTCRKVVELALQRDLPLGSWLSRPGRAEIERGAERLLEEAGLAGVADEESTCISHGLQKRLEIAIALANASTVLLLDEPMAGMSQRERVDLSEHLRGLAGTRTIVFVEHDIDMVMSLAQSITVLHNGSIIAEGTPDEVRRSVAARDAYLGNRH